MNKEINELDRMTIGVREWAVETILTKGLEMDRWLRPESPPNTGTVCELATQLEEYVLRGIKDEEKSQAKGTS